VLTAPLAACRDATPSEIVVAVSSQLRVPRVLRSVRVVARGTGTALTCESRALDSQDSLPLVVSVPGQVGETIRVTVAGYAEDIGALPGDPCAIDGGPAPRIVRRAVTRIVSGERLHLGMPLRQSCIGVTCGDGETCAGGECQAADIAPERLVEYSDALANGNTSYCLPRSKCFDGVSPALPVDMSTCTFQLPDEDSHPERLNVEILHDDFAREVLDLDPIEGFSLVPGQPRQFRLAPPLCRRLSARKIATLFVGADCPPKDPLNPLCREDPPDGGPPLEDSLCTSPADVAPTRAAVYALMDRSHSMRQYFGPSSFKAALDLALRSPALRTTSVGFRFMPSSAGQCTAADNAFSTLDGPDAVPFGASPDVRDRVIGLIGDLSRVAPDDAPLFLDAVLRSNGAYRALENLGDPSMLGRRYALLIGNRDFTSHCEPSIGTPPGLAYDASINANVHTAALLLKAAPDTNQNGHDPYIDALSITHPGEGPFGDASSDDDGMRVAIAAFIAELGGCLYDLPPEIDRSGDLQGIKISYFDVLGSKRVDVDRDILCGPEGKGNGWNIEGSRVRLCGKACGGIRFVLHESAVYTLQRGFVQPDVPVKWSPPCAH
jgi:hypothetical protein